MSSNITSRLVEVFLILLFALGFSRVFFLTVFMKNHFVDLAEGNMIKLEYVDAKRGVISDKNGKSLAMNIENNGRLIRYYPFGEVTAGVVGYIGKPTDTDQRGDILVGKAGLESEYQNRLAGEAGEILIEETALGARKTEMVRKEAVKGENLMTNLDMTVQQAAHASLVEALKKNGKSGAVVVTTVGGRVIALVSAPAYDANLFIEDGKRSDYGGEYYDVASLLADTENKPLFNRAFSGEFAPGSVYKLVPAMSALEEKKITKDSLFDDSGEIVIGNYRFGNWLLDKYGQTEGKINVVKALARSNDIFFYKVGEALGIDSLVSWSNKFGLGEKTGVDLPGETGGFMPSPYWREKTFGEKWFLGNTYHLAIGQGDLMASPLQINMMTAAVVSGFRCSPRLVGESVCTDLKTDAKNRQTVLEGMKAVCLPGGTAFPLYEFGGKIFCKTGTAQKGGEETLPNAWMSVVVPVGSEIKNWVVISVLIEEGGEGSAVAAPVAKDLVPLFLN